MSHILAPDLCSLQTTRETTRYILLWSKVILRRNVAVSYRVAVEEKVLNKHGFIYEHPLHSFN